MKNINLIVTGLTLALFVSLNAGATQRKATTKAAPAQTQTQGAAPAHTYAPAKKATSFTREYGMAGCGLGSMVVGKKGGQIFAATTNGTAWNQTFAITAGTSNCVDSPNSEVAQRMDTFIASNKLALASDIARGNGETLVNISGMMGCADQSGKISKVLQSNFNEIFPSSKVYPNEITDSIISTVLKNQELSASCKKIG
ncbi:MAG: DUF3015 family protein [Bdellovibrionia bacterium]